ncbi:hypothetical protein [Nocardioides solisilvae]|uniref:hypothetical protein n=1 Tax=Nocardioides solisilvae TaxID=1542435 RepID=UPI000D746A22|nr:hypothetical protein [Nocardioides solisilvae]
MNRTILSAAATAALASMTLVAAPVASGASAPTSDTSVSSVVTSTAGDLAARKAKPKKKATVRVSVDQEVAVVGEDTLWFNGRTWPKVKGQRVILQQRLEGNTRWSTSGKAKVRANGRFVLKDEPSAPGTRYYRIRKSPGKGVKLAFSDEMKVVVYRWDALTSRAYGPKVNVDPAYVAIGARSFPNSLATKAAGEGTIEYTLGGRCTKLRATYALTDNSATGATGTAKLEADGATKVFENLTVGAIKEHTSDITGAFRVLFRFNASENPAAQVAAGDVQVLCTK